MQQRRTGREQAIIRPGTAYDLQCISIGKLVNKTLVEIPLLLYISRIMRTTVRSTLFGQAARSLILKMKENVTLLLDRVPEGAKTVDKMVAT